MKKTEFKASVYGDIAGMVKAMSNPHRLEILDLLANGPKPVETIAAETRMTIANTSQHLQVMKHAMLVKSARKGTYIFYEPANAAVIGAWQSLRNLAVQHSPNLRQTLHNFRDVLPSNTSESLLANPELLQEDNVIFIDVRPESEFVEGHLPNALCIPVDDLPSRLDELPKDKRIIVYCRGPFCVFADEAVQLLTSRGFDAMRLEEGYADYKQARIS